MVEHISTLEPVTIYDIYYFQLAAVSCWFLFPHSLSLKYRLFDTFFRLRLLSSIKKAMIIISRSREENITPVSHPHE